MIKVISTSLCLLLLGTITSLLTGPSDARLATLFEMVREWNPSDHRHLAIYELRLPRTIMAAIAGASLATAGALMQALTRNPMAGPSLLGLSGGAALATAIAYIHGLANTILARLGFCILGAFGGIALVMGTLLLSVRKPTPVTITLAGAAVSSLLSAVTVGLITYHGLNQEFAFWTAGTVSGTTWVQVKYLFPWTVVGLLGAWALGSSVSILALGEEQAVALGQRIWLTRVLTITVVFVLVGIAVAGAGPVGFVGILTPHLIRFALGGDYKNIIPCSAFVGAALTVWADTFGRAIIPPYEIPLGALTALLGAPLFLYLASRMSARNV